MWLRDGIPFFIFVRHQAFSQNGKELADDGSLFPGSGKKKAVPHNTSAFDLRSQVMNDPAMASSSEEDSEEVDYNNDAEETEKEHTHLFTVNLVLRYPDENDDLILHWGLSRKRHRCLGYPRHLLPTPELKKLGRWPCLSILLPKRS